MEENKAKQDPFAEYMWMENMDDFDRQVEEQLLEEEFIRTCIEQLLEEEDERETLTAAEIMAQQQLQNLQVKNAGQQGTSQGLFRNGFQSNTAYSNGYTNGFSSYDHNVVVSSGIASVFECFIVVFISGMHAWGLCMLSTGRKKKINPFYQKKFLFSEYWA